jgi:hypothetical protein
VDVFLDLCSRNGRIGLESVRRVVFQDRVVKIIEQLVPSRAHVEGRHPFRVGSVLL